MKTIKKNVKIKKKGGADANVPRAAVGLVKEAIGLTTSIFSAIGGIMSMPADMAKAVPPSVQKNEPAQVKQPQPAKLPQEQLDDQRVRVKGK